MKPANKGIVGEGRLGSGRLVAAADNLRGSAKGHQRIR